MNFLNLISRAPFLLNDNLFSKKLDTSLSLNLFISLQVNQYSMWKIYQIQKAMWTSFLWDFFSRHSFSLNTETEAAYDNYKIYDWLKIEHIVVSRDDCKQKIATYFSNRSYTLVVISCGK